MSRGRRSPLDWFGCICGWEQYVIDLHACLNVCITLWFCMHVYMSTQAHMRLEANIRMPSSSLQVTFKKRFHFYLCIHVCLYTWMNMCRGVRGWSKKPEEGVGFPGAGVTIRCEPPMGSETKLWSSARVASVLNSELPLQPLYFLRQGSYWTWSSSSC